MGRGGSHTATVWPTRDHYQKCYQKIAGTCNEALRSGIQYVWVDTCCIDKTNSTELAEAINSMFRWYEEAEICFAHLADVPSAKDVSSAKLSLARSRWFTRGWTLQELLAPRCLEFFTEDWAQLGNRDDQAAQISKITGINDVYLTTRLDATGSRFEVLCRASVSERMSWAAGRKTTRAEDQAYCLFGIFGINMPLIYGEGINAFPRLQHEIMRGSFDPTLLAWTAPSKVGPLQPQRSEPYSSWRLALNMLFGRGHPSCSTFYSWWASEVPAGPPLGVLAITAEYFRDCKNYVPYDFAFNWSPTNEGISVSLPVSEDPFPYMVLPCALRHDPFMLLALQLDFRQNDWHARLCTPPKLVDHRMWHLWPTKRVQLVTKLQKNGRPYDRPDCRLQMRNIPGNIRVLHIYATDGWILGHSFTSIRHAYTGPLALLLLQVKDNTQTFAVLIREIFLRGPACYFLRLATQPESLSQHQIEGLFNHLSQSERPQISDTTDISEYLRLPTNIIYARVHQQHLMGQYLSVIDICESSGLPARLYTLRFDFVRWATRRMDLVFVQSFIFVAVGFLPLASLTLLEEHTAFPVPITSSGSPRQKFTDVNDIMRFLSNELELWVLSIPIMLGAYIAVPTASFFYPRLSISLRQHRRKISIITVLVTGHLFSSFVRRVRTIPEIGSCKPFYPCFRGLWTVGFSLFVMPFLVDMPYLDMYHPISFFPLVFLNLGLIYWSECYRRGLWV